MTEDKMVGWHHHLKGRDFEQAPGAGDGQEAWGAAVRGVAEMDTTEREQQGPSRGARARDTGGLS